MHSLELSRIRYVITSYLRHRLRKIERYALYILQQEATRGETEKYLSPQEKIFADEYVKNTETLFNTVASQHLPVTLRNSKYLVEPNMSSHVFFKVMKENVNAV